MATVTRGKQVAGTNLPCALKSERLAIDHVTSGMRGFSDSPRQISRRRLLALGGAGITGLLLDRRLPAAFAASSAELRLQIAPHTFEVAPGREIRTAAYNGSVAGVLHLPEGQPVDVEIENRLATEELVHWHGFELDPSLDGTAEEGSLAVPAAGRLRYTLPPQRSGSFYVHSHAMAHGDMTAGMYSGQFAFVYVEPRHNPGRYDREVFLSTHEWDAYMVNESAEERTLEEMHHLRIDPEESEGVGEGGWDIRYRVASINGRAFGHGEPIRVRQGERVLFHLLNGSATENIELALPGHTFLVVAMDGFAVPHPAAVETVTLGVGERMDVLVEMSVPGIWVLGSTDEEARTAGLGVVVEYAGASGDPVWIDPAVAPAWDYGQFAGNSITNLQDEEISFALTRLPLAENGAERWALIDAHGQTFSDPIRLERGRNYRLKLRNDSDESHPMHLHRHSFTLARYGGKPIGGLQKDTVLVQPRDTVELLLTPQTAGPALFHCHNQMHMDAGMYALFQTT
jgi:FtsP/CotA-like multicopper oxidase with cupredoxin domain